ncbi:PfaB family protein [Psychromonas sp. CD1]|uniref:PfaB family protein n=1 Tax=Psychromonas sp. CD1 TaxID=1979839 RepID=UPI000B9B794C|nr:PfaB family protein [Psychromonas sp. CD1]
MNSLNKALLRATAITQEADVAVLLIASSCIAQEVIDAPANISFATDFSHYANRQGGACLLLASANFVQARQYICYATLNNMAWGENTKIAEIVSTSLQYSDLKSADICTLEVSACAQHSLREKEQLGLLQAYRSPQKMQTVISCQKSVLGENGALSQLMALVHSVLSLYQRYRPAVADWTAPTGQLLALWQDSPFYFLAKAASVFSATGAKVRSNALSLLDAQQYTHLIVNAYEDGLVHPNGFNACSVNRLFILSANNIDSLIQKLDLLTVPVTFNALSCALYEAYKLKKQCYTLVLIADSEAQLESEKILALKGIRQAFTNNCTWTTPKGSCFFSQPNRDAKVAFLFPGIGASYLGMGQMIFQMFPDIYPQICKLSKDIGASLKDTHLNPRTLCALNSAELNALELKFRHDLANIAECGVGYACVFTAVFELVFKLKADNACGYSMGEVSMFAALGCWQNPGDMSERLAHSDTFNHQLSHELYSVRKYWELIDTEEHKAKEIWETYAIKGTFKQVNAALKDTERVYITIINTSNNLLIAGYPEHCLALCQRLGVRAIALNIGNALHCAPAYLEYNNMLALYAMPVRPRIHTKMLSSSCYLPIPQHQQAIAVSIAKCLCDPVDFPRLINTLAKDKVRVYIEMGAGRSLSGWTDKILKGQLDSAHVSVPINVKGMDQSLSLLRALAKLLSFGVEINIECFFSGSLIK